MIAKSYEILKNTLSFSKYNLYLLYGENDGLKKDILESIKKIVIQKEKDTEIISLSESDALDNDEKFYNILFSGSLFSKNKIVIIKDTKGKIVNLIEEIKDKNIENITIIIFSNILDKKSALRNFFEKNSYTLTIPCYPDTEKDLEIIANNNFKKNNIIISRESINLLIEKSNYDRNNLRNEIEKIVSFCINKKKIDIDEIKSIINFSGEFKSDTLINECLCGNVRQYKKILSELYLTTINQIFLFRILSKKIQRLLIIKESEPSGKGIESIMGSLKPPIFWKEKTIVKKQLSIWNLKSLKSIVYEMNSIELLCKKNPQLSKTIFFNFFSKICTKANSFS